MTSRGLDLDPRRLHSNKMKQTNEKRGKKERTENELKHVKVKQEVKEQKCSREGKNNAQGETEETYGKRTCFISVPFLILH